MSLYKTISHVPAARVPNLRNDMYLAGDAMRLLEKEKITLAAPNDRMREILAISRYDKLFEVTDSVGPAV